MAVSALAGCVTIERPPVSGPPPAPAPPSAPYPDDDGNPQIVQAPVHEALERVGPSRRPEPEPPERHGPPAEQPAAPHSLPRPRPPEAHPGSGHHGRPRVKVPDVSEPVPKNTKNTKNTDVCALGRQYGGWPADSPESVICKQAYGS